MSEPLIQAVVDAGHAVLEPRCKWLDPTPEMLETPRFEAVWQCIKQWDINVPDVYVGYMGATGNHVRAILDALDAVDGRA